MLLQTDGLLQDTLDKSASAIADAPADYSLSPDRGSGFANTAGLRALAEEAHEELAARSVAGIRKAFDPKEKAFANDEPSLARIHHALRQIDKFEDKLRRDMELIAPGEKLDALIDNKARIERLFELSAAEIRGGLHRYLSNGAPPWHACHILQGLSNRPETLRQVLTPELLRQTRDALEEFPSEQLPRWKSRRYPDRDPVVTVNIKRYLGELDNLTVSPTRPKVISAPRFAGFSPYGEE